MGDQQRSPASVYRCAGCGNGDHLTAWAIAIDHGPGHAARLPHGPTNCLRLARPLASRPPCLCTYTHASV